MSKTIDTKSVNTIRVLCADTVEKAKSGHPGLPLGSAAMAYELWSNHMNHNPKNPQWINRDRFILSAGHASSLLYALLHLYGYGLTMEDLQQFRQLGSLTPGHPEYGLTKGVEASTGPLGAGLGMAVGIAMAEAHLAAKLNKPEFPVIDHYTFALCGDGCLMEGISSEAFSLAGTLKLGKLIVLYDSNKITIEGSTDIAFTEDVAKRMEAFGFQTLCVEDGNDLAAIAEAIEAAKADQTRPSFITVKTQIGYGCPAKEGKASAHGEPLGTENVKALKENLGFDPEKSFHVDEDVYANFGEAAERGAAAEQSWNALYEAYLAKYPEMKSVWDAYFASDAETLLKDNADFWKKSDKAEATRVSSGNTINTLKDIIPNLFGGAADLAPSTKTYMNGMGDFSAADYSGNNLHFGVREMAMGAIGNGILLHGGLRSFVSTFFVFSDYLKPMIRMAAIMELPQIYVFTHDSIGVGEDGPTHEPIEQLADLRALPGVDVYRPADAYETQVAWYQALCSKNRPSVLVLSRQNLKQLETYRAEALKGAYIVAEAEKDTPDAIIIATGSELGIALEAKEMLKGEAEVRVVSMLSQDVFEAQDPAYKETVLPGNVRARVAVEALSTFGWERYTGLDGKIIGMNSFGASAPAAQLFAHFGITKEAVAAAVRDVIK